jgi:hypothetical protein
MTGFIYFLLFSTALGARLRFSICLAAAAIPSRRFDPAVAATASSRVLQRVSGISEPPPLFLNGLRHSINTAWFNDSSSSK